MARLRTRTYGETKSELKKEAMRNLAFYRQPFLRRTRFYWKFVMCCCTLGPTLLAGVFLLLFFHRPRISPISVTRSSSSVHYQSFYSSAKAERSGAERSTQPPRPHECDSAEKRYGSKCNLYGLLGTRRIQGRDTNGGAVFIQNIFLLKVSRSITNFLENEGRLSARLLLVSASLFFSVLFFEQQSSCFFFGGGGGGGSISSSGLVLKTVAEHHISAFLGVE